MRILLLGNTGQLGWELERSLVTLGQVRGLDYPEIDLSRPESLVSLLRHEQPHLIVNATAYTAVDKAENEPGLAAAINTTAPAVLAEEALALGAALVHFSTDFVFDGTLNEPYTEAAPTNPLNVYGQSKLDGERAIQQIGGAFLILRTSWVYSLRRPSFVTRMLQWSRSQPSIRLVSDQVRSPTWCRPLAEITAQALAQAGRSLPAWLAEHRGLYHLGGRGAASMFDWGQAVLRFDPRPSEQIVQEVLPARTAEFPTPAARPLYSVLDCSLFEETFGLRLPDWQEALRLALEDA